MGKRDGNKKKQPLPANGLANDRVCPTCSVSVGQREPSLECDVCGLWLHAICTGISGDTFDALVDIVKETGWVCRDCRVSARQSLRALQAGHARLAEEMCSLATANADLTARVVALEESLKKPCNSFADSPPSMEHLKAVVSQVICSDSLDKERRRNNIIVSGFPMVSGVADSDAFLAFCEANLHEKPLIVRDKCRRIDKAMGNRIPRLRVVFANCDARDTILKEAKLLKDSADSTVRNVYLNPDLTPAEATAAYEARLKRRAKRANSEPMVSSTVPPNAMNSGTNATTCEMPFQQ